MDGRYFTDWFNDLRVVVNSVTDLLTSSLAAHPEIFTLALVDSTHIVGHLRTYIVALTQ